jgi:hypothetical protein
VRADLGCSVTAFYEAVTRLYRSGRLPPGVLRQIGQQARFVDEERGSR